MLTLDRQRANSLSKDDTQAGLKIVLFALCLFGIGTAAGGLQILLGSVLGGFKEGGAVIKVSLPADRRRCTDRRRRVEGAAAAHERGDPQAGRAVLPGRPRGPVRNLRAGCRERAASSGVFMSAPWGVTAQYLAGDRHRWRDPVPLGQPLRRDLGLDAAGRARRRWQHPPQYPPQGGGYPPQGGGYPPQGGGYPPQGGGGYPPQGGGGYPPQGGGGYPPQGGYGR